MTRNVKKMLVMIDSGTCSSYDKDTLVEISAGFDGSEGGEWPPV